ncbi:Malectin/receptor-like protein kinase family protein [Rhynchospora pubera]|uniref:non-specific serine/threonine protein kinase n=1 Tax=Rhynchospora pubera TaxID=906938 RepID=A0AAV8EZ75_9POAL|nr:Malectin/receptor-like protein kinase family protein [Rhynchospora pubera]
MNFPTSSLILKFLSLLCIHFTVPALAANSTFTHILLNCGTSGTILDANDLTWVGDIDTKYISKGASQNSTIPYQDPNVPSIPFSTARIFTTNYTYKFPLSPGRYFLRLYFYPTNYSNHLAADSFFTATAGPYTLLSNFSALITVNALNYAYLIREFSINVTSSTLDLTFAPSTKHSNAFAFINGIEIVSSPDDIFSVSTAYFGDGTNTKFPYDPGMAFQTMYRLNVGGQSLASSQDSGNLYRTWDDDSNYIFGAAFGITFQNDTNVTIEYPPTVPQYIAPVGVYETARSMGPNPQINLQYNLTWVLTVDAGFYYLLRFHFCEIQYPMTKANQRVFFIYINNQTAQTQFDVIAYSGGIGKPVYMDYVVITVGSGQMDMWVALHPDLSTKTEYYDAILNGLEVFKMSMVENNLAGLNPVPIAQNTFDPNRANGKKSNKINAKIIGLAVGVPCAILLFCLLVFIFLSVTCKRQKKKEKESEDGKITDGTIVWTPLSLYGISNSQSDNSTKTNTTGTGIGMRMGSYNSSLPANLCRHFTFTEILTATKGFDESLVLGVGGFGKVYQGEIDNGLTKVAIKRANPLSEQGFREFQTEIEMLSKLRHRHLVSLIGYCEENNEMILVYDYMAHGTLRKHLYKSHSAPLTWNQRLEICIGAARGLHYLHTGAKHTVIHRDVKTTNILLDEKWVAKVSDFGLSKTGPTLDQTHVSTVVKGSIGYLDPEYFKRHQLTDKSDVYSFGVVLFEVLCARPVIINNLPKEEVNLAEWALFCQRKGVLEEIIDPYLRGKIAPQCFKKFAETAVKCLAEQGVERPTMGDVLWNLEFALQLQESAEESGSLIAGTTSGEETPLVHQGRKEMSDEPSRDTTTTSSTASTVSMGGRSIGSVDSDGLTPSAVFSQLMNPKGR